MRKAKRPPARAGWACLHAQALIVARTIAALAQLVEHRIRNAGVRCSSHLSGTIFPSYREEQKRGPRAPNASSPLEGEGRVRGSQSWRVRRRPLHHATRGPPTHRKSMGRTHTCPPPNPTSSAAPFSAGGSGNRSRCCRAFPASGGRHALPPWCGRARGQGPCRPACWTGRD